MNYNSIILVRNFNSEINNLFKIYRLSGFIRESTCYKYPKNPPCLDFQNFSMVEIGLSDFHRKTSTAMKTSFHGLPQKARLYRYYSNYDHNIFCDSLFNELSNTTQQKKSSITNFSSKCDQIRRKIRIWSCLLKNL